MKLIDLNPIFASYGGSGVSRADGSPIPETKGVGVIFDCPCGVKDEDHRCFVIFKNPIGPGPGVDGTDWYAHSKGWQRTGETFETLTLTPSIQRLEYCRWHGWITAGETITV